MKYVVLRNCYTEECRYFHKGDIVDLPDSMYKDVKNFRPLSELEGLKFVLPGEEAQTEAPKDSVCTECGKECKSAFGLQSHMRSHK